MLRSLVFALLKHDEKGKRVLDLDLGGHACVVDRDGLRLYANGTTMHGAERVADLTVPRPSGMAYYHRFGPMGQIMSSPRGHEHARLRLDLLGGEDSPHRGEQRVAVEELEVARQLLDAIDVSAAL